MGANEYIKSCAFISALSIHFLRVYPIKMGGYKHMTRLTVILQNNIINRVFELVVIILCNMGVNFGSSCAGVA